MMQAKLRHYRRINGGALRRAALGDMDACDCCGRPCAVACSPPPWPLLAVPLRKLPPPLDPDRGWHAQRRQHVQWRRRFGWCRG